MKYLFALLGIVIILAALLISGCERKVVIQEDDGLVGATSCFTCHGDDAVTLSAKGEWANSTHASGNNVDYTNRGGGSDCTACHDHQGFLDFIETGTVEAPYDQVSAIHCFTCHDPHSKGDLSLRVDDAFTLANGDVFDHNEANICASCHHSRSSVDVIVDGYEITSKRFGPHHGPQADLLNSSNGYEYTGVTYGNSGHASMFDNTGCIVCHMGNPRTHVGYRVGGHSFNMVDTVSGATLIGVCEECHPTADDYDYDNIQTDVTTLLDSLKTLLIAEGVAAADGYAVPQVMADGDLAGAFWNFKIIEEDRSLGVHNPEYILDLLESSIAYVDGLSKKKLSPFPSH